MRLASCSERAANVSKSMGEELLGRDHAFERRE
jgi:hypothetical protein